MGCGLALDQRSPRARSGPGSIDMSRSKPGLGLVQMTAIKFYIEHSGLSQVILFSVNKSYLWLCSSYAHDTAGLQKQITPT